MKVFIANGEDLSKEIATTLNESSVKLDPDIEELPPAEQEDDAAVVSSDINGERTHQPIYQHTPFPCISRLLTTLYVCGAGVAIPSILDQLEIKFIVNVAPELPDTPLSSESKPLYLRLNALDKQDVDLSVYFDEVSDMIEEVRQHGGRTLVHCVAGVSRSVTLCIAYLMKHMGMSLRNAYQHIKDIRSQIRPNTGFFQQLMRYEEKLFGSSSVKMVHCLSLDREIPDVYEPEYRAMEEFYQKHRRSFKRHCSGTD